MTMYNVVPSDYFEGPAGTPGWEDAPVPGWGINPFRAGPVRVGVDGLGGMMGSVFGMLGDAYTSGSVSWNDAVLPRYAPVTGLGITDNYQETSWGMVALVASGSIGLGLLFGYAWWGASKSARSVTPNRPRKKRFRRRNARGYLVEYFDQRPGQMKWKRIYGAPTKAEATALAQDFRKETGKSVKVVPSAGRRAVPRSHALT